MGKMNALAASANGSSANVTVDRLRLNNESFERSAAPVNVWEICAGVCVCVC